MSAMCKKTLCAVLALSLGAALATCGSSFGERKTPQISVKIEGEVNPDSYQLPVVRAGQTDTFQVEIMNIGGIPLSITKIELEPQGNPYISLSWSAGRPELPRSFAPNDELDYLQFQIVYRPENPPSFEEAVLRIESNDPERGSYRLPIAPVAKEPKINVNPKSYTFLNATHAVPETQTFSITNQGSEALIIYKVDWAQGNPEFTLVDRPVPNAEVPAQDIAPDANVIFVVRYQPLDNETNDRAVIEIHSNDPKQSIVGVELKSKLLPGKLNVSYEDMLKGFVDFQALINAGEQNTKAINLYNEGPGPIRITGMQVEPPEAAGVYKLFVQETSKDPVPYDTNERWGIADEASLDVLVEYTAPGPEGIDGTLVIYYENPYQSTVEFPLKGGNAKPDLTVYPSTQEQTTALQYHTDGPAKSRTVVLSNRGVATVKVTSIRLERPPAFEGQPEEFQITNMPTVPLDLPGLSLLPLEVRYKAESDAVIAETNLVVAYLDASGTETIWNVRLTGYKEPGAGIVLPVADPGMPSDYAGAVVGAEVQLDAMGSAPGDAQIASTSGYVWYLASKPTQSAVNLNRATGPTTSFIPDKAGSYRVVLFVQTDMLTTGEGTKYCGGNQDCYFNLWGDQAVVDIEVAATPAQ